MVTFGLSDATLTGVSSVIGGAVALSINQAVSAIKRRRLDGTEVTVESKAAGVSCVLECAEVKNKKELFSGTFGLSCKTLTDMEISFTECKCTGFAVDCKTVGKSKQISVYKISFEAGDIDWNE